MSSLTLQSITTLRTWARRAGLVPFLKRWRHEEADRVRPAVLAAVRPGDCVWDVGANVGDYAWPLAEQVGPSGCVIAFEPAPASFTELEHVAARYPNIRAIRCALGDAAGELAMAVPSGIPNAPWNSLARLHNGVGIPVHVETGDRLVAHGDAEAPNVVKIDVEGYEAEVIRGMRETLSRPDCRAVFVELHFSVLEARGQRHAPSAIVEMLKRSGYHVHWLDLSHLAATRRRPIFASHTLAAIAKKK